MDSSEDNGSEQSEKYGNYMTLWHWLVVIGTLVGTIIESLVPHSFGTLIASFRFSGNITQKDSVGQATQFQLNWLPATSSALPSILLPLFVLLVQVFYKYYQFLSAIGFLLLCISCGFSSLVMNWHFLLLTYSVLYSIGGSLFLAVVVVITAEYFPVDHRFHVLATTCYQTGYPIAALVGNPLIAVLIVDYGWQNALKFAAAVNIIGGLLISYFMKPIAKKGFCNIFTDSKEESPLIEKSVTDKYTKILEALPWKYLLTTYQMWPWLLGKYFNYTCWYGLRTNIVTYLVQSTSFGLMRSAILMSTYAAAEMVVAVTASLIGDKFRGWLIHIHILSAVLLAIFSGIYMSVLSTYLSAVLLMIGIGMSIQLSLSFGYPASVEVWNSELDMKTCWILTNVAAGLGIITSPLFSGILMDLFGVGCLFYAQCFGWLLQAVLFSLTLLLMKVYKHKVSLESTKE